MDIETSGIQRRTAYVNGHDETGLTLALRMSVAIKIYRFES